MSELLTGIAIIFGIFLPMVAVGWAAEWEHRDKTSAANPQDKNRRNLQASI